MQVEAAGEAAEEGASPGVYIHGQGSLLRSQQDALSVSNSARSFCIEKKSKSIILIFNFEYAGDDIYEGVMFVIHQLVMWTHDIISPRPCSDQRHSPRFLEASSRQHGDTPSASTAGGR